MTVGDKIKYCRCHCKITQAKLAELSGISLVSIKRYETNKTMPTKPQIKKISNALGVNALAFFEPDPDAYSFPYILFVLDRFYNIVVSKSGIIIKSKKFKRGGNIHITPRNTAVFRFLDEWVEMKEKLQKGEITREQYDMWTYRYPNTTY